MALSGIHPLMHSLVVLPVLSVSAVENRELIGGYLIGFGDVPLR